MRGAWLPPKRRLLYTAAFVAVGLWILAVLQEPFLKEVAQLTPFMLSDVFFQEMTQRVGGLLFYVSSLLQSCCAHPWLGASLLVAVLTALAYAIRRIFRVGDDLFGLCFLAPAALLAHAVQTGYLIYVLKTPAVLFTPALGWLLAMLSLPALTGSLPSRQRSATSALGPKHTTGLLVLRVLFLMLFSSVGYYVMGCYALAALCLAAFSEIITAIRTRRNSHLSWSLAMIVLALTVPHVLHNMGIAVARSEDLYMIGTPDYRWDDAERHLFIPLFAVAIVLMLLQVLPDGWKNTRHKTQTKGMKTLYRLNWGKNALTAVLFVASLGGAYTAMFKDANFRCSLEMKQAAEHSQWDRILQLAAQSQEEPTRLQVCLTRLALYKTGRMGDELFTYPDGSASFAAPRQHQWLRLMGAHELYRHYGKLGFAYRWAMEDLVEYGERPMYLRTLYRIALMNGEQALADKYAAALRQTLFFAPDEDEAKREQEAILPLLNFTDMLDGDNGLVEFYLLQGFALTDGGSRDMVELSLMCSLITKRLDGFWPKFHALLPTWGDNIPTHYQEAALMIAQLQGGADISRLPVSDDVRQRFAALVEASARLGDNAGNATVLRPQFGNTFWYYYFFMEGMKTQ